MQGFARFPQLDDDPTTMNVGNVAADIADVSRLSDGTRAPARWTMTRAQNKRFIRWGYVSLIFTGLLFWEARGGGTSQAALIGLGCLSAIVSVLLLIGLGIGPHIAGIGSNNPVSDPLRRWLS